MRRLALIGFLILSQFVFGIASPAQAQSPQWYYGFDNETGQVIAYDLLGQVVPLLTLDIDFQPRAWRIDGERMLAVMSVQTQPGVYILSPAGAQALTLQGTAPLILGQVTGIGVRQDPYWVLEAQDGAFSLGILVDLVTNSVTPLAGESFAPLDNWRISQDNTLLRYLSRESRESTTWNIVARQLSDGSEQILHSFESNFPTIQTSGFGDLWMYRFVQDGTLYYNAVFSDGSTQILAQEPFTDPSAPFTSVQLFGDVLLVYRAPCPADCQIEQRPLLGGIPSVYPIAQITAPPVTPFVRLNETQFVGQIEQNFWLFDSTTSATPLGQYTGNDFPQAAEALLSPNGEWLVSSNGTGGYQIWYTPTASLAYEGVISRFSDVIFGESGMLISQFEPRQTLYYRYASGERFELPHNATGGDFYFAALADGTLLYTQTAQTDRAPGVYRYDPVSGAATLLVQNLFPLDAPN